jgi:hypothetical protein
VTSSIGIIFIRLKIVNALLASANVYFERAKAHDARIARILGRRS